MEILLWLVPPVVVTGVAMVWVSWLGRPDHGRTDDRSEATYARFAEALARPLDSGRRRPATRVPARPRDRSTGVAVRPSRRTGTGGPGSAGSPAA